MTGSAVSTVGAIAKAMAASLSSPDVAIGEAEARRLAFWFAELLDRADASTAIAMVGDQPTPVGDRRFDALVAAVVEHGCGRLGVATPQWANDPGRFLDRWWFVAGVRSLHADALVHAPISFARRGVFITDGALAHL